MTEQSDAETLATITAQKPRWSIRRRLALLALSVLTTYLLVAYVFMPRLWERYAGRHPALEEIPNITYTGDEHPGDPINVALIGSEVNLHKGMLAAGWYPADPVTLKSSLRIAEGTVFDRPYDEAPVSPLYLWGRKQDLAFEKPVGDNPRKRHHVRFWKSAKVDDQDRPLWAGSVTYDERVGLSHTTGQVTHHIGPDIDAERDELFAELEAAKALVPLEPIDDFHVIKSGRNGGGDPWRTDGRLYVGELQPVGR